jgi:hypothetical protein
MKAKDAGAPQSAPGPRFDNSDEDSDVDSVVEPPFFYSNSLFFVIMRTFFNEFYV